MLKNEITCSYNDPVLLPRYNYDWVWHSHPPHAFLHYPFQCLRQCPRLDDVDLLPDAVCVCTDVGTVIGSHRTQTGTADGDSGLRYIVYLARHFPKYRPAHPVTFPGRYYFLCYFATAMGYIADTTSVEDRAKGVGLMGAAMGTGMIFGPLLGGVLTKIHLPLPVVIANLLQTTTDPATGALINLSIPFFTSALLALIAVPFVLAFLPESLTGHQMANMVAQTGSRVIQLLDGLRGPIGFLYAMAFLLAFALTNMESVLGVYGQERFNIGPSELEMLMGAMGILSVIQQGVVIGPLTR